jgi:hypothetical protein
MPTTAWRPEPERLLARSGRFGWRNWLVKNDPDFLLMHLAVYLTGRHRLHYAAR